MGQGLSRALAFVVTTSLLLGSACGSLTDIASQDEGGTTSETATTGTNTEQKVESTPQSLIQVLMGEARSQIYEEAQVENGTVTPESESPTANAIGAVIRNRVLLIESGQPYSLFVVDEDAWKADPPFSHWDSVILAEKNGIYQFSPVDPSTMSHDTFLAAASRTNLTNASDLIAYDQAVLTAAGIFTNEINDPTGGAFAFRTPTLSQTTCLEEALKTGVATLSEECGPGDENFPAFAPVQILIHPSIAQLEDGRPSFVFYRNRSEDEPAVTNAP